MMSDIELLRKEIEKLRKEIEGLKERERIRDLEERDALLLQVRGIERRHGLGKYASPETARSIPVRSGYNPALD